MTLTPARIRAICLDYPDTAEEFPFDPGLSVFKVAGKVFALTDLASRPLTISLKCDPEVAIGLRATHPQVVPGYHLNKRHWNTVTVDGVLPDVQVEEMIQDSFDLVVDKLPRHQRLRLR